MFLHGCVCVRMCMCVCEFVRAFLLVSGRVRARSGERTCVSALRM